MPTMTALEEKLAKLNNAPPETPPETVAETAKPAAKGRGKQAAAPMEATREDKAHVGAWLHKDFKRSLLLARGQTGEDVQTFFARVLNAEFKSRGVPLVKK